MSFLLTVRNLLYREMRLELNTGQLLGAMLLFSLLAAVLFSMAFSPGADIAAYFPGVFWFSQVFAVLLVLNRAISREKENGCLELVILAGSSREAVMVARILANLIFFLLLSLIITPIFSFLFDLFLGRYLFYLLLVVLVFQLGLAITGSIMSYLVSLTRLSGLLLPVLLLPLLLPLLLGAVETTSLLLGQFRSGSFYFWIMFMLLYDLIYFALAVWAAPYLLEV